MQVAQVKTHQDSIWISTFKERAVVQTTTDAIQQQGFNIVQQDFNNFGYPYIFVRNGQGLHCRFVDSVFLSDPVIVKNIKNNIKIVHHIHNGRVTYS